jgi:hypothetical protein
MSVVSRAVAAIPVRASVETWDAISHLLAPASSAGRSRLESVTNIAAVLIAAEYTQQAPILVMPRNGPRVRIRTVHGADAEEARAEEIPLVIRPCAEPGWTLSLPCGVDDVEEIRGALRAHAGIEVRDLTDGIAVGDRASSSITGGWSINYDELGNP